jgi:prepilin-type N-terminal cleavage/methylation domain-containing protein
VKREGFTLLEVMISVAILGMVSALLFGLANSVGQGSRAQEAKITTVDDARTGMMLMARDIRQASKGAVSWILLPGPMLIYRTAVDLDGNGFAVDVGGYLELSPVRMLMRDLQDINGDRLTDTQLVMVQNGRARVLANGLMPDEDINGNGALDPGEDSDFNGVLDRGLWFERVGSGIQITLQTQRAADPEEGLLMSSNLTETVLLRN